MTLRNYNNGWLEVICGCMYAGKSSELLRRVELLKRSNLKFRVFTPKIDNRYGKNVISNHNKMTYPAISVVNAEDIKKNISDSNIEIIIIDEIQLFNREIVPIVESFAQNGKKVIMAGLITDYRGNPFEITSQLLARAEFITRLEAICAKCFSPATKTQRLTNNTPSSANEPTIKIGNEDSYEPRCRKCHVVPDYEWWKVYA